MRIRVALLIVTVILIAVGAVFSVIYYDHGREGQYDEYILKYSKLEGEPGLEPVDPAVVKAIMYVTTNFVPSARGPNDERGLMLVPKEGVEKFMDSHGNGDDYIIINPQNEKELGFVCPNRSFPNHKNAQKLYPRADRCPVCGKRTVEAIFDWEANIRIGTWYLAHITAYLKKNVEGIDEEELLSFSIFAYTNGLETVFADIEARLKKQIEDPDKDIPREVIIRSLRPYMEGMLNRQQLRADIERIKREAEKFRPRLEKRARKLDLSSSR